ncbi:hypothetical protein KQH60_13875 [Mycetohabitans sp. B8]|uniref:hypothetical protein n=1 Tax=Mycetohabitans sp. B8 TaxID=2841845 RepID=UPI001F3799E9|nr:hypothetical protein [Mycetohabitans sp. B8]MCG1043557.1 hypothetical protein [Mycetohabitans sp. B8]
MSLLINDPWFSWFAAAPSVASLIVVQAILSIALAGYAGRFVRVAELSLANNPAVMLFGGFGPFSYRYSTRKVSVRP